MDKQHAKLAKKGWTQEEIEHAYKIKKQAEKKKSPDIKKLEKSLYWMALIIGIVGTLLFSLVAIPVILASTGAWAYIIIGVFALFMGSLIIIMVHELEWLESHHHLFLSLLVPIIAIFNFFIVVNNVNLLSYSLDIGTYHNPVIAGIVYFVCFAGAYGIFLLVKKLSAKK